MTVRHDALEAAIARLSVVLKAPESDVSRDAAIQRFEFCFELAWKSKPRTSTRRGSGLPISPRMLKSRIQNFMDRGRTRLAGDVGGSKPNVPYL